MMMGNRVRPNPPSLVSLAAQLKLAMRPTADRVMPFYFDPVPTP